MKVSGLSTDTSIDKLVSLLDRTPLIREGFLDPWLLVLWSFVGSCTRPGDEDVKSQDSAAAACCTVVKALLKLVLPTEFIVY